MQRWRNSPARDAFADGDILLSIDGAPIATKRDIDVALVGKTEAAVTVFREGKREVLSATVFDPMADRQIALGRVALWAGAVIREIPDLVQWLYNAPANGVYISSVSDGSPCQRYRLPGGCIIREVDGV